jgi:diguanylate cyclase (GGDEF)-like protein
MPGSGSESARTVAERIRERIEFFRPQDSILANSRITVSIGLATSSPDMSGRDLVERADRALYLAKREGKNQVRTIPTDEEARFPSTPGEPPGDPNEPPKSR